MAPQKIDRRAADKLEKAMVRIILTQPFFAMLLVRLVKNEDRSASTMWTDGREIGYNPAWVNSQKLDEVTYSLFAMTYHVVLKHNTRRGKRDETIWNEATDQAVCFKLIDSGFLPPPSFPQPMQEYENLSAEEIYLKMLPPEQPQPPPQPQPQPQPQPGEGEGEGESEGDGGDDDNEGEDDNDDPGAGGSEVRDLPTQDQAEIAEEEASWEVAVNQAAQISKAQGKLPAGVERLIEEMKEPVVDWKKELVEFLLKSSRDDYSWRRPNRRHVANNIYLPSMMSDGNLGHALIGVDTSGSIGQEEMDIFGSEMTSIVESLKAEKITVVYCDSRIGNVQEFTQDDLPFKFKPAGGGGTSFSPVMGYVEAMDEQPVCCVYFTDGYCSSFGRDPGVPVIWIITRYGMRDFSPPFGRVVYMTPEH